MNPGLCEWQRTYGTLGVRILNSGLYELIQRIVKEGTGGWISTDKQDSGTSIISMGYACPDREAIARYSSQHLHCMPGSVMNPCLSNGLNLFFSSQDGK